MNQAVHVLRLACLPCQDHMSIAEKKKAGMKFVSELLIDFEILKPIDPEQFKEQVIEAVQLKR